ncbi:HNH endonuclease signature motif containing protein [Inquilinus sp. OTU3971]|uniref:HNH endonuclease signature motif containing protein n=1 Tax=Inquilinus sp. OTU3971 TaxID=3043855 RepID=UPI00313BACD8
MSEVSASNEGDDDRRPAEVVPFAPGRISRKPNRAKEAALSADRARDLLDLDPETGIVRWRVNRGPAKAGSIAGTVRTDGYMTIGIDGRRYLLHRVVYLLHHGHWPAGILDHVNGDPRDNRPINIRLATVSQNGANKRRATSKSGFRGVYQRWRKWLAQISVDGRLRSIGMFSTSEDAARAYDRAAVEAFGQFATTNAALGLLPAVVSPPLSSAA